MSIFSCSIGPQRFRSPSNAKQNHCHLPKAQAISGPPLRRRQQPPVVGVKDHPPRRRHGTVLHGHAGGEDNRRVLSVVHSSQARRVQEAMGFSSEARRNPHSRPEILRRPQANDQETEEKDKEKQ